MIDILVIGETCVDKFIYCEVKRFSPEAPVPILNPLEISENQGMSGNVVRNIQSLSTVLRISHVHQNQLITKTRFVEKKSNHMFLRFDEGESELVDQFSEKLLTKKINDFDIVIVSDYHKGFLSDFDLISIGKSSKLSILDSKRKLNLDIINSFDFVKLNEIEFKNNSEFSELDNIIITLGSRGCSFKGVVYQSPNPQETIDVSGAGDTFTSSFILKYFETNDIDESMRFANQMASIVVSKRGVSTPL
jgi:bifunctional ADP-heptose synthase (sugar kinase/adenylyltransferase)